MQLLSAAPVRKLTVVLHAVYCTAEVVCLSDTAPADGPMWCARCCVPGVVCPVWYARCGVPGLTTVSN